MTPSDSSVLDSPSKGPVAVMFPDVQGTTSAEMLVGSQKRKARKTKITHLVRTADGSVSPAEGEDIHVLCLLFVFFVLTIPKPRFFCCVSPIIVLPHDLISARFYLLG